MINELNFSNKQILISGAAAGIGREIAIVLSNSGAKLVLLDVNENGLKELHSCLAGEDHYLVNLDLSDLNRIEPKIKNTISLCGPFDGFIHCVGIRCRRPLAMITPKKLTEVLTINFGSFVELTRCITKKNNYNKGLSIVGISSVSSQRGGASVTAYAASKAAMDSAVRCLAKELAPHGIRINTVVPAQVKTPAYSDFLGMLGESEDKTLNRQYLGIGEPIDVARVVAFLLSDSSKLITGSAIPVDGGYLAS